MTLAPRKYISIYIGIGTNWQTHQINVTYGKLHNLDLIKPNLCGKTYLSSASSHTLYILPTSFFNCLCRSSLNVQSSASIEVPTPLDVDVSFNVMVDDSSVDSSAGRLFSSRFPFTGDVSLLVLFIVVSTICLRFSWRVNQLWTFAFKRNIDERYVCNWAFSSCKKKTRNSNQGIKFSGIICEKRVIENRIGFGEIASKLPNDWTIDFLKPLLHWTSTHNLCAPIFQFIHWSWWW